MAFDWGDLAGTGASLATGNIAGAAISAVGLGMSIFGGLDQSSITKQQSQVSGDIATQEQGINDQKQQAMELAGRRQQLEIIRNNQRARALAENSATNQGAQFGSGLQGGLSQIADQSSFNLVGVNSALETGRNIAGYNSAISKDKIRLAQLGGQAATAGGFASLGGSLLKSGPMIGSLAGGFGSKSSGGNYSGTPGASNTGGLY
jgi:hypothetical protein